MKVSSSSQPPATWLLQSSCRRCVVTSLSTSRLLYSVLASSNSTAAGVSGMAAEMRNYTAVVSNTQQNCGAKYYLEQQHGVLQRDDQHHLLAPRHVREHAVHRAGQAWGYGGYLLSASCLVSPMSAQLTMTPMTPMISMAVCQHPMFCTRSGNGR